MVSPVHGDCRPCQAEIPLIVLFIFPGPALKPVWIRECQEKQQSYGRRPEISTVWPTDQLGGPQLRHGRGIAGLRGPRNHLKLLFEAMAQVFKISGCHSIHTQIDRQIAIVLVTIGKRINSWPGRSSIVRDAPFTPQSRSLLCGTDSYRGHPFQDPRHRLEQFILFEGLQQYVVGPEILLMQPVP